MKRATTMLTVMVVMASLLAMPIAVKAQTFAECFDGILARDPELLNAKSEVEKSEWTLSQRRFAFGPSLSFEGSETWISDSDRPSQKTASLQSKLNLFKFGGDIHSLKAAQFRTEGARQKYLVQKHESEGAALSVLLQVVASQRKTQIAQKAVELQERALRVSAERFRSGLLPQQEVEKATIESEIAASQLADARTREAEAKAKLKAALGHDQIGTGWPWTVKLKALGTLELVNQQLDLSLRPDWASANWALESARQETKVVSSSLWPSLDFVYEYGIPDLRQTETRGWSASLALRIPIWDRGETFVDRQKYAIMEGQAARAQEHVRLKAASEVESARFQFGSARESALKREKTAELSDKLLQNSLERFRLGRATVNDLNLDHNRFLQAEALAVDGWVSAHMSYARLCHALGKSVKADAACEGQ